MRAENLEDAPTAIDIVYRFFDGHGRNPTPAEIREYMIWSSQQTRSTNRRRQRAWCTTALAPQSRPAAEVLITEAAELFQESELPQNKQFKHLIASRAYSLSVLSKILYPD